MTAVSNALSLGETVVSNKTSEVLKTSEVSDPGFVLVGEAEGKRKPRHAACMAGPLFAAWGSDLRQIIYCEEDGPYDDGQHSESGSDDTEYETKP